MNSKEIIKPEKSDSVGQITAPRSDINRIRITQHALLVGFSLLLAISFALANPLEGVQVNQNVGQSVVVGDGDGIAQLWTLDAKINCLAIDPFGGSALLENIFELLAAAINLVTQTRAYANSDAANATVPGQVFVVQWLDSLGAGIEHGILSGHCEP